MGCWLPKFNRDTAFLLDVDLFGLDKPERLEVGARAIVGCGGGGGDGGSSRPCSSSASAQFVTGVAFGFCFLRPVAEVPSAARVATNDVVREGGWVCATISVSPSSNGAAAGAAASPRPGRPRFFACVGVSGAVAAGGALDVLVGVVG